MHITPFIGFQFFKNYHNALSIKEKFSSTKNAALGAKVIKEHFIDSICLVRF